MANRTIVFDFDGVIHKYRNGWQDGSIYDDYNEEVINIMHSLMISGYSVAIVSTRDPIQISEWWNNHQFPMKATPNINGVKFWSNTDCVGVFNQKIPAMVYIDDRGLTFEGDTEGLYKKIVNFETYQEKKNEYKLF